MSSFIHTQDIADGVRQISFNRPERKNAFTTDMYIDLEQALKTADSAKEIKVILIYGNQTCFSAGNDIKDFLQHPPQDENSPVFSLLRTLNKIEKPIIAAVNGVAVGIGTTLLLHCDFVYANESTLFSTPFVNLGCTPEGGSSILFDELMGQRKAAEFLLLCQNFNADKAAELGIITAKSLSDNALNDALEVASGLAAKAPDAVIEAKRIMKAHKVEEIDQVLIREARLFCDRLKSAEAQEALNAFIEKRKPDFSSC